MKVLTVSRATGAAVLLALSWGPDLGAQPVRPGAAAGRNPFQEGLVTSTPSIARADLQACKELTRARPRNQRNLDPRQLMTALRGTWARELTWYGVKVETESALFFDVRGDTLVGMMYDQSNLGAGPMTARIEQLKRSPDTLNTVPTITFVDCDYSIVDKYYKVSTGFQFDGLADALRALAPAARGAAELKGVWDQMVASRFFARTYDVFNRIQAAKINGPNPKPVPEVLSPSVGGVYWTGYVRPQQRGNLTEATLRLDGEYRGSHVGKIGANTAEEVRFAGSESARFVMEGDLFVASTRGPQGPMARRAGLVALTRGGWSTDCAGFFDLPTAIVWERVVLDPGGR